MSAPKIFSGDAENWARRISQYLDTVLDKLSWKRGDEKASENGIILWDETIKSPVVSVDGEFVPFLLKDGDGMAYCNTDITAAATNTAYPIVWDGLSEAHGITLGTPASRIVFEKGGTFMLAFSVQITSSSSNIKNLWFFPRINGVDVAGSTIKVSISDNGATIVMSRSAIFTIEAGDYIEACWATSSTAVTLESVAAETFAPSTPSVTLSITRLHQ